MSIESQKKYFRLVNYIAAAQLYLKDNFFLEQELSKDNIKNRILGHWGTVPGLNFIYLNLNRIIKKHEQNMMVVIGPGHGYPALLANLYVEGSMGEFYPEYKLSKDSFEKIIKNFSWPGGFPSHANPETPGVILEGGELGYSLSTSFGAVMDNPNLVVACVVGDGEAETGPTATAWHSTKFLNPIEDGAVLPIVHINKYKISGPTIYGTMSNDELINLFSGYGYEPIIVDDEEGDVFEKMNHEMEYAYSQIKKIQNEARESGEFDKPRWPVILYRNKKGWTGPKEIHGKMIEDSYRSHGIPLEDVKGDEEEFEALKNWLHSYNVNELLDENHTPIQEILDLVPQGDLRMGMNKSANNMLLKDLTLPDTSDYEISLENEASSTNELGKYLRDVIKLNPDNFRIFCPDETDSNKLNALFEETTRRYMWPVAQGSSKIGKNGRVMEMLSEHTLQGWFEGYALTGRHGVFISYEAFMMIIASMVDQYSKFLKQAEAIKWRKDLPSLNFILTSTSWRQDHNGFSHQNPGFISSSLNDYSNCVNINFPPDANSMISVIDEAINSKNRVNVIIAGKRPLKQYLSMERAKEQTAKGLLVWDEIGNNTENPDIVFAATGDYATQESISAIRMLKKLIPEIGTRFVSISELTCFGIGDNCNICKISMGEFDNYFTQDKEIVYSYHGYPEDIKSLIFNHPAAERFHIFGYQEQGTTTTPFDMQVKNKCSRIHLALQALESLPFYIKGDLADKIKEANTYLISLLEKHNKMIKETGEDIEEITKFDEFF